ncbi:MAG: hypothetical protein V2A76_08290 [Planctomycetota bacterium]
MRSKNLTGFGLIELIIVVALLAALAGVLTPVLKNEMAVSRESEALASAEKIAEAITRYMEDTSHPPCGKNGIPEYSVLHGEGTIPSGLPRAASFPIADFLFANQTGTEGWRGPYSSFVKPDPYGRAYVVTVIGFQSNRPVWVLSAGRNGHIDTRIFGTKLEGDDIGVMISQD